jgi:hypothetical protein
VRAVSLIVALLFAFGGARYGWSCPSASVEKGCCCDKAQDRAEAEHDNGPRLERACCCVAKAAKDSAPRAPTAEPPSRDGFVRALVPHVQIEVVPPRPVIRIAVAMHDHTGPPPETLFLQHTLLLS